MAFSFALQADTLHLRDGRTIQGTFLSGDSREIQFSPERGGNARRFPVATVDHVAFGDSAAYSSSTSSSTSSTTGSSVSGQIDQTRARNSRYVVPPGAVVTVRLIDPIDSNAADVNHTYRASLDEPIVVDGRTVAPKGADVTLKVVQVEKGGVLKGSEEVSVVLQDVMVDGRRYVANSQPAQVSNKGGQEHAKVIGGPAVVGAIIGAIAGGGKGAAIGAATGAGAGAAVQAIRGQRVKIPSESKLDFTLAEPIYVE